MKTVNLVLKNTQEAEALVKLYETKLCEEEAVIADKNNIENLMSTLKVRVSQKFWTCFQGHSSEYFSSTELEFQTPNLKYLA